MSYIKINGEDTHYNVDVESFTTQHLHKAVRFIGDEIPSTNKGFKMYNDNDEEVLDLSAYIYEYRPNEYSIEEEEVISPEGSNQPLSPSVIDVMNNKINQVNSRVNAITPYEETKRAYYGENEKVFYGVPLGNVSIFFSNYVGEYTTQRISDRLVILFPERLQDMTDITIMVQK